MATAEILGTGQSMGNAALLPEIANSDFDSKKGFQENKACSLKNMLIELKALRIVD
jgi:hypothetical protein